MSLVIYNGTALTMNKNLDIVRDAVVEIRDGLIRDIRSAPNYVPRRSRADRAVDARGGLILPGFVNCHTHVSMSLLRGVAEDVPLQQWLSEFIFPLEKKWGTPEFVFDGALLACLEMIRTGTTLFNDMYYFEEEVARAAQLSGLRAVCGQTVIEDNHFAGALDQFDVFLDRVKKYDRVYPSIAPHAIYDVSQKTFERLKEYADKHSVRVHLHVAETQGEVDACLKTHGMTPVEYLEKLGFWGERVIAAHATCLTERDIEILGERRAKLSHNPESNLKLGTKISPVARLQKAGAIVGLGTDGSASNNNLDLLQEIDFAAKLQTFLGGPGALRAESAVKMLTIDGAKALGLDHIVGSLELGKAGDVVVVDLRNSHSIPLYNPYAHLVYSATGSDVRHSVVSGNVLMEDFVIRSLDEASVLANASHWGSQIASSLGVKSE